MNEPILNQILEIAVREGTPEETMPPFDGPPGWNPLSQQAYLDFFGARLDQMYAIAAGDDFVGSIRLTPLADRPGVAETGMWLGRAWRRQGIGSAALHALIARGAQLGYTSIVADTTPANIAALGALVNNGAVLRTDDKIYAIITIDPAYSPDLDM